MFNAILSLFWTDLVNHLVQILIIQVHIPQKMSRRSMVFKMKCEVTSSTTHDVLISKEIGYKSYKEICSGEKKKVNLGFNNDNWQNFNVSDNVLLRLPKSDKFSKKPIRVFYVSDAWSSLPFDWEFLYPFFTFHNIEPNWLDCNMTWGWYDEDLGGWTGCMGKV